jgi:TRAP-type C4-dicarboxylate transport system permease small subunit
MLLISGPLIAENGHVAIDMIVTRLQGKAKLLLELFNISATIIYGAAVSFGGIALIRMLYERQAVFPKYFPIPKWIVELCIPLGMIMFTVVGIIEFYNLIKRYQSQKE